MCYFRKGYIFIGDPFGYLLALENVTILSTSVDMGPEVFTDESKFLKTIYFSKSTNHIEGLPLNFI